MFSILLDSAQLLLQGAVQNRSNTNNSGENKMSTTDPNQSIIDAIIDQTTNLNTTLEGVATKAQADKILTAVNGINTRLDGLTNEDDEGEDKKDEVKQAGDYVIDGATLVDLMASHSNSKAHLDDLVQNETAYFAINRRSVGFAAGLGTGIIVTYGVTRFAASRAAAKSPVTATVDDLEVVGGTQYAQNQ